MPIPARLRPQVPTVEEMREYMELCNQIEDARPDLVGALLERWNARASRVYRQVEFKAYAGAVDITTFVGEMLLGVPAFVSDLTYDELREVLRSVRRSELSEAVLSYFLNWLDINLPGAGWTNLIYWPNEWFQNPALLHVELNDDQMLAYAMAKSGRHFPDAPAGVAMPYPIP